MDCLDALRLQVGSAGVSPACIGVGAHHIQADESVDWDRWRSWAGSLEEGKSVTQAAKRLGLDPMQVEGPEKWRDARPKFVAVASSAYVINKMAVVPTLAGYLRDGGYECPAEELYLLYTCLVCVNVYDALLI